MMPHALGFLLFSGITGCVCGFAPKFTGMLQYSMVEAFFSHTHLFANFIKLNGFKYWLNDDPIMPLWTAPLNISVLSANFSAWVSRTRVTELVQKQIPKLKPAPHKLFFSQSPHLSPWIIYSIPIFLLYLVSIPPMNTAIKCMSTTLHFYFNSLYCNYLLSCLLNSTLFHTVCTQCSSQSNHIKIHQVMSHLCSKAANCFLSHLWPKWKSITIMYMPVNYLVHYIILISSAPLFLFVLERLASKKLESTHIPACAMMALFVWNSFLLLL